LVCAAERMVKVFCCDVGGGLESLIMMASPHILPLSEQTAIYSS
jgi:hypothetical protein